jgi:hypothetical protein
LAPFSLPLGTWMARKGNWYRLLPLFGTFSRYDAVIWWWKLTPLVCGVWVHHRQASSFPAHVLVLVVTIAVWRLHQMLHPHGRSGVAANFAFWSFVLVLAFQGYLVVVESVADPTLPARFTAAFSFVLLSVLLFVIAACCVLFLTVRAIWLGPSPTQKLTGARKRSFHKSALTASVWVEDYANYVRRQGPQQARDPVPSPDPLGEG